MVFVEGTKVIFNEMCGEIKFVCPQYVVIETPPAPKRNPPRIIVFGEQYKNIQIEKASSK